jgi:leucyl-tRNA synthetase
MKVEKINKAEFKTLITLLNPVAPHITEELWQNAGFEGTLSATTWPKYDEAKTVDSEVEVVVQINGKIRDKMMISAELDPKGMEQAALESDKIKAMIEGKQVVKVIAVPKKLINIVVK